MLNEYYQNVGIKGYISRYGLKNGLKRAIFTGNPLHFIHDYEIKKVLWQKKASRKIGKYLRYKDINPEGITFGDIKLDNPIWIYWNKGIENAPDIVKACYSSICKYAQNAIILLNEENVSKYVVFPEYIERKVQLGCIPIAGYTDLLRFTLLEHFGGTWIDSTVLLTEKIPDEILNSDFFAFQNSMGLIENPVLFPAWFLHAKKENKIITQIRNVSYAYWKKENHVIEYLLPNLIITNIIENKKDILYLNSDYSEYLFKVIADNYSEEGWKWITGLTGIHKLSYKLSSEIDYINTYYGYIIKTNKINN